MVTRATLIGFWRPVLLALCFSVHGAMASAQTAISSCGPITASGSYQLVNNLVTSGDCLVLAPGAANNVTIDLNGFTIFGDGTGTGIRSDSLEGFTIRNGTVKNFDVGIQIYGSAGLVEKVQLIRNAVGLYSNDSMRVKDSIVYRNADGLWAGEGSELIGNIVTFNLNVGMIIQAGSTLVNNTVYSNRGVGISVGCPSTLLANTATGNAGGDLSTAGAGCVNGQGIP